MAASSHGRTPKKARRGWSGSCMATSNAASPDPVPGPAGDRPHLRPGAGRANRFPRLRTDGVPETGPIVPPGEPIRTARLFVAPPDRELIDRVESLVGDHPRCVPVGRRPGSPRFLELRQQRTPDRARSRSRVLIVVVLPDTTSSGREFPRTLPQGRGQGPDGADRRTAGPKPLSKRTSTVDTHDMDGGGRPPEQRPIRVFLLDDHEIVRRGIGELLAQEPGLELVGQADSAGTALDAIGDCDPDVAVLDVRLGGRQRDRSLPGRSRHLPRRSLPHASRPSPTIERSSMPPWPAPPATS